MKTREYRPLPDEFNLGYIPPHRDEEEEEKKKKRRRLRRLMIDAAVVFLILPLSLKTGLFRAEGSADSDPSGQHSAESEDAEAAVNPEEEEITEKDPKGPDGTYVCGSTVLKLDQGRGWYFSGEYFIPLHYDPQSLAYRAAGTFPDAAEIALDSMVYYADCEGTIEITDHGVRMYDPFAQQTSEFERADQRPEAAFISQSFSPVHTQLRIEGYWQGSFVPDGSIPMAYMTSLTLSSGGAIEITVANTENDDTSVYTGSYTLHDGILSTSFDLPITYEIVMDEQTVECSFEQTPEGILYYTESGCYIFLNIFSSQLFVHS